MPETVNKRDDNENQGRDEEGREPTPDPSKEGNWKEPPTAPTRDLESGIKIGEGRNPGS